MTAFDIPNFHRLLTQARHHNLDPHRVLSLSFEDFPNAPRLRHEFQEATRHVTTTLQCMDGAELEEMVANLGWFFQDRVNIPGILAGDSTLISQAASYVIVSQLTNAYFDLSEVLAPLRTQLENSVVLESYPELKELIDEDGLLVLSGDTIITDQYVAYRDHCLYYHQFFRRGYKGNVNPHLFYRLAEYHRDQPGAVVRVAIDHRRIVRQEHYMHFLEKDWWGLTSPVDLQYLDDPKAVGLVRVSFPADTPEARLLPFDRAEILCYLQEEDTKVLEMEEVAIAERDGLEELPVVLNRYVHSERDMSSKAFGHLDGAVRSYQRQAYQRRMSGDIADAKAVSERIKLFRIDGPITEETWSALVCDFYRGNDLVTSYLSNDGTDLWRQ